MIEEYYVYLHLNKTNGKRYYGITSEKTPDIRWRKGYTHNQHFQNAIKKYGWDGFEHIIIASKLTKKEAEQMEVDLIKEFDTINQNKGYNLTSGGGSGVFRHSEESKRLMSEHTKGELNPMYGKHHSEETRKKISERLRNNPSMSKKVRCIETGIIYPSIHEAERQTGGAVGDCLRGKQKTAAKCHWEYVEKEIANAENLL